jgi:hypothetical protein
MWVATKCIACRSDDAPREDAPLPVMMFTVVPRADFCWYVSKWAILPCQVLLVVVEICDRVSSLTFTKCPRELREGFIVALGCNEGAWSNTSHG